MKEDTISGSYQLHEKIDRPLTIRLNNDQTLSIIDEEANEDYAYVKGKRITFYNSAYGSNDGKLTYLIDEIESIKESDISYVLVTTTDGQHFEHRMRNAPSTNTPIDFSMIRYQNPSYTDVVLMMHHVFSDPERFFFKDVLTGRLCIDMALLGKRGYEPLQGMKNNPQLSEIRLELEKQFQTITTKYGQNTVRFTPNKSDVNDVMHHFAQKNERNLFLETIRRVEWDGVKRVSRFLYECGGRAKGLNESQELEYLAAVIWALMLGVIEKNKNPTHQPVPVVPILMGPQGCGKSTVCRRLGGKFYTSTHESFDNSKAFFETIEGGVIVELKESTQFQSDGSEKIKAFIDGTELKYRKSYAEESSERIVRYCLIGTTNDETVLSDSTGNRRFFPVFMNIEKATIPPFYRTNEEIAQMWAEVLEAYNNGCRWSD